MGRTLSTAMSTEVGKPSVSPIVLVEMDFASGFVRAWSGYGELAWDSKTWLGAGHLMSIEALAEDISFVANGAAMSLSGIPSEYIAIALAEHYQGRPATIYLGMLDSAGAIVVDPVPLYSALMDTMEIDETGDSATIVVRIESQAAALKRAREYRYTHEDQQIDYPGDMGFEYVAALQDKELTWKPA